MPVLLAVAALASTATVTHASAESFAPGLPQVASSDDRMSVRSLSSGDRQKLQSEVNQVLASTKGAVQISANEVSWNGGEPVLVLPLPGQAKAPASSPKAQQLQAGVAGMPASEKSPAVAQGDSCPTEWTGNDWYCFYQYKDFEGRRLQWNQPHPYTAVYFSDYGFNDMASSWSNKGGLTVFVRGREIADDDNSCNRTLWIMDPHSRAAAVVADNQADCFHAS
ncbi:MULTISPECIES: peptidase inhibitor family I36 protein [unclassified Streptomyces]|uniref:peptidase inhibitor family I36 protein n=1 Tax=unclassified Streptomyces TaxID=2593676 RepID=UPI00324351F4